MLVKLFDEQFSTLFNNFNFGENTTFSPNSKINKEKDAYILKLALPGLKKEDVNIKIDDGVISITYNEESENDNSIFIKSFNKRYKLSSDIDIEKIKAKAKDGILTVTFPFKEEIKTERIIEIS